MSDTHDSMAWSPEQDNYHRGQTIFRDPMNGLEILRMTQLPNGLTVVDFECDEAAFFARKFLRPTNVILDRPGKPKSRWVYRSRSKRSESNE